MFDKIMSFAKEMYRFHLFHISSTHRGEQIPIGKSELEQLLFKATSGLNFMLPHEQLYDIAERTHN